MKKSELEANISDMLLCWSMLDRMEEEGDCIIWTVVTQGGQKGCAGYPMIFNGEKYLLARRVMLDMCGRVLLPDLPIMSICGTRDCVNPAHLKQVTCSVIGKKAAARGVFSTPARAAAIAAGRRKSLDLKLNAEKAREIRLSDETADAIALRLGIHKSTVKAVRRFAIWRELPGQNPWAGLMRGAA